MSLAIDLVGWSPFIVLPLAAAVGWAMARIGRAERAGLPESGARRMAWLRGGAAALLVLLLAEPVLTIVRERSEDPVVAVLLDGSGSMAVHDAQAAAGTRLDEAVALGLLAPDQRPDGPRRAARLAAEIAAGAADPALRERLARRLAEAREAIAGQPRAAAAGEALAAALAGGEAAAVTRAAQALREAAEAAQAELDAAQARGAPAGSPLATALAELDRLDRRQRAERWLDRVLAPALAGRAELRVLALDGGLAPHQRDGAPPSGPTDPQAALAALARGWSGAPLGAVLVLGDGRQTAGGDPAPAARALLARGAPVSAIAVGDPLPPRDLAVAELVAPAEVMQGERIPLEARWRAIGYDGQPLELVLLRDGREVERRPVQGGDGTWRSERFEPPAGEPGLAGFQVRLERRVATALATDAWQRTWWSGSAGVLSADRQARLDRRQPSGSDRISGAADIEAPGQNLLMRIDGTILPPIDGEYVLHLSADDQAELRIGLDGRRIVAAEVPSWCERGQWDRHPGQRSARIALAAGRPVPVEVWLAQAGGSGFAAIGWTRPDGVVERPIPTAHCNVRPSAGADDAADRPEASPANNQAAAVVQVHGDPLRVLLLDRTPRWEPRYLASLLMRDRRVEVERRWLIAEDAAARRDGRRRPLLPDAPGELDRFDAVVLGDLGPGDLAQGDEARLADFVERRGGFLVLIAGERAMPGSLGLGRLATLAPVRPGAGGPPAPGARLQLSAAGRRHPATMLLEDRSRDPEVWPLLAVPAWLAGGTVRTGAEALVELDDPARTPVVVAARSGAGRIFYLGTHEAWRWRDRIGERLHQTLWLQAFRWGLGGRLRGADPRLLAALDAPVAAPGETVELRLRSTAADGSPAPAPEVTIEALDEQGGAVAGSARRLEPAALGDGLANLPGQWRVPLAGLAPGRWRLRIAGRGQAEGLGEVRELMVRERAGAEQADLAIDLTALERLAGAGGGRAAHLLDAAPVVEALAAGLKPRQQRSTAVHPIWDGWIPILAILALLLGEWLLRRRHGLP